MCQSEKPRRRQFDTRRKLIAYRPAARVTLSGLTVTAMRKIGYARVSTEDQNLDLQIAALQAAQCEVLFQDHGVSGASMTRPGLDQAFGYLEDGDTLVVWRLDRLGRSLSHLVNLIEELKRRTIHFQSLTESIDTTTSGGMLVFHMMAALAQFERSLIGERTKAGMQVARLKGKRIGRRPALAPEQREEALRLLNDYSIEEVAARFGVSHRTIRRARKERDALYDTLETVVHPIPVI
jgi:DNA invertase Pin-like site-specific DNA recombinase